MQSNKIQAGLFATLCVLLWGLIPVVAKVGQTQLDSQQFLFWSSLISSLTIFVIALVTGKWRNLLVLKPLDWLKISAIGFLGTYLYYLLLYQGYQIADGVEVLVTQYTWPALICVLSVVLLKEAWNRYKTLSVAMGFASVILIQAFNFCDVSSDFSR